MAAADPPPPVLYVYPVSCWRPHGCCLHLCLTDTAVCFRAESTDGSWEQTVDGGRAYLLLLSVLVLGLTPGADKLAGMPCCRAC